MAGPLLFCSYAKPYPTEACALSVTVRAATRGPRRAGLTRWRMPGAGDTTDIPRPVRHRGPTM